MNYAQEIIDCNLFLECQREDKFSDEFTKKEESTHKKPYRSGNETSNSLILEMINKKNTINKKGNVIKIKENIELQKLKDLLGNMSHWYNYNFIYWKLVFNEPIEKRCI